MERYAHGQPDEPVCVGSLTLGVAEALVDASAGAFEGTLEASVLVGAREPVVGELFAARESAGPGFADGVGASDGLLLAGGAVVAGGLLAGG